MITYNSDSFSQNSQASGLILRIALWLTWSKCSIRNPYSQPLFTSVRLLCSSSLKQLNDETKSYIPCILYIRADGDVRRCLRIWVITVGWATLVGFSIGLVVMNQGWQGICNITLGRDTQTRSPSIHFT